MSSITCAYCGESFTEDLGQMACAACPMRGGCRFIRCPKCGYENPCEPEWVARLRSWLRTQDPRSTEVAAFADPDAPPPAGSP
jgi:hypothetical protein